MMCNSLIGIVGLSRIYICYTAGSIRGRLATWNFAVIQRIYSHEFLARRGRLVRRRSREQCARFYRTRLAHPDCRTNEKPSRLSGTNEEAERARLFQGAGQWNSGEQMSRYGQLNREEDWRHKPDVGPTTRGMKRWCSPRPYLN